MNDFPKRLKNLRLEKELSQEELGRFFNLSKSTISLYESGKREPDYETLKTLAKFFGCSTDYLLGISDEPGTPKIPGISDEYIYQANDLGQAIIRIIELDHELGFDDQTLVELIKKAKEKYGMPEPKHTEPAAHGPVYPGSGAFDDE